MRDIAHFEIALRNAYDVALTSHWDGSKHWLLDPDSPAVVPIWRVKRDRTGFKRGTDVNFRNRRSVDDAIRSCGGAKATPGKVMAELSFGFWRQLTTASHEKSTWIPYVHHAFPTGTNRSDVDEIVGRINGVRNRIAHHEPVFDRAKGTEEPPLVYTDLIRVLGLVNPDAAIHVGSTSTVLRSYAARP